MIQAIGIKIQNEIINSLSWPNLNLLKETLALH